MADMVLFEMYSGYRDQLIERQNFYVEQAKSRLLDQFTDEAISAEADRVADDSWERRGRNFNPEFDDEGSSAEAARDDGIWRYELLTDLRDSVRLSIVAGFFHEWEKNLRQWLVDQVRHWHSGQVTKETIWKQNLSQIFELLESFGWPIKTAAFFPDLDACRLVVNVHKHGDGPSLTELASSYPQYLEHPLEAVRGQIGKMWLSPSHENLKITDDNLEAFSEAVLAFWRELPENICSSHIKNPPHWFLKAIEKDERNKNGSPADV